MKNRVAYLREFGSDHGVDFNDLTLPQRLFLSICLTKYRYDDSRMPSDIIWEGRRSQSYTKENFKAYEALMWSFFDNELNDMFKYVKKHAKDKTEDGKWLIRSIDIDLEEVFLTRNGDGHQEDLSKKLGIPQISCKAFALAASKSNLAVFNWRSFNVYNWIAEFITEDLKKQAKKSALKHSIKEWAEKAKVSGKFDELEYFIVDIKEYQKINNGVVRDENKNGKRFL